MYARLRSLLQKAETRLGTADQARLAEIVEDFVALREGPPDFTAEELDHLKRVDEGPFAPADPAEVAALFARHG